MRTLTLGCYLAIATIVACINTSRAQGRSEPTEGRGPTPRWAIDPTRRFLSQEPPNPSGTEQRLDFENAFRGSEWMGIGEYRSFENKPGLNFINPPAAIFECTKVLKGPFIGHHLNVIFDFRENPQDNSPPGWEFSENLMPKKGSSWIIFIPDTVPKANGFTTYRGRYGRQQATEDNLAKVYAVIEKHKGEDFDRIYQHTAIKDLSAADIVTNHRLFWGLKRVWFASDDVSDRERLDTGTYKTRLAKVGINYVDRETGLRNDLPCVRFESTPVGGEKPCRCVLTICDAITPIRQPKLKYTLEWWCKHTTDVSYKAGFDRLFERLIGDYLLAEKLRKEEELSGAGNESQKGAAETNSGQR
jgi:hypothetical protein